MQIKNKVFALTKPRTPGTKTVNADGKDGGLSSLKPPMFQSRIPYLLAIFLSLLLTVPLIDFGVHYLYAPRIERDTYDNLRLIAKIKALQYERWRESRKGDADVLVADHALAEQVKVFQTQGKNEARQRILERFDALIAAYDYESISLLDLRGEEIIHRGMTNAAKSVKQTLMQQAQASGKAVYSDLYLTGNDRIQLDVIAPIIKPQAGTSAVMAYIIIHTGSDRLILPRILLWPSASSSAEVLIVSRDAHSEKIIHTTSKKISQALVTRLPQSADSPYSPTQEFQHGFDYHGKYVYTLRQPISQSSWSIVTQVDRQEMLAPLNTLLFWVSLVTLMAGSLVALTLVLLWQQQRRTHELQQLADSGERDRLLKQFFELPFVGMGICDPVTARWLQANNRLCDIFGYTRDELLQMTLLELTQAADLEKNLPDFNSFLRSELPRFLREKRFIHKSGRIITTRTEIDCLRNPDGSIAQLLVVIEDITERKQAEVALRVSEERLSLVFKGTNDGWWDLDLTTNQAYHSARWWAMLGYPPDQDNIDPTLWQRITHPDDVEPTLRLIQQTIADGGDSYEVELRLRHSDGHYVPILTRAFILRDEQGKPVRISGANMDLTPRHAAEAALRMQEEFNRVLLENQADGVIACDANMQLVLFNHVARDWHGLDALHIAPLQWSSYFGLYDASGEHELATEQIPLVRAFNGEHLQHEPMAIRAKGQPLRLISCSATPFFDGNGKKLGAVAIMRDITALRQHSAALEASEALYRQMFEANPHPMWVLDAESFAFLAVNDAAIGHYGWSDEEFLAMKIGDILPTDDAGRLANHLPKLVQQNITHAGEWRHVRKDGSIIDVEITSHVLNFNGRDARLMLAYDITERKRYVAEVRLLNRLLSMLTNINQTIIRRLGPLELFNEACTIAVRDGGFRMAWVGMVDESTGMLKDVSIAGHAGDYVENLRVDMRDLSKNGPSPRAIREGVHVVCQDIARDESFAPWRKKALLNGYRSMVALPLRKFGKVIGNFSLYSAENDIFNPRELDLLDELAEDISFALEVLETEKQGLAAQQALQESERLFHTLSSASPVGVLHTDIKGRTVYANQRCFDIAGLPAGDIVPADWARVTHPDDRERVQTEWRNAVREQRGFSIEYRFQRPDNSIVWVQGQAEPEKDAEGKLQGFVGTITDITAVKASEESLRMAAAVFENTREGILVTDSETRILMINKAFTDISHYDNSDALGQTPKLLASGRHDRKFYSEMWRSLKEIGHWQGEIWNRRKNGDVHPVLMSISAISNQAGAVLNYVGVFADISNLKASEAQLEFLAHHDPLTRLPNRLMLISQLSHAIEVARRDKSQLALLMLDLDRFKNVNDSFGHLAGDELLQQVAKRLSDKLRGVDTITRLGGDEFTVLLQNLAHAEDAARVAESIIAALQTPWTLGNNIEVRISASIGISLYPGHGDTALELLQHADAALYQAKAAGRGCARYFSESLTKAARDRFNTEARLRLAVENNELRVYYQPKVDMQSGKIVGAEALLRWQDATEGLISPLHFIGIAEETGLIGVIGEWMMRQACEQGQRWREAGLPSLSIAVNLSANQLHHSNIVEMISGILDNTGFPGSLLELELTESILMQREEEIVKTLNALRARGVRLAIDDFGTGYSSLAYLKSFPLDVLKIDRSFVADIEEDADDRAITATIIGIAHTLDMLVVAEGVETAHQLEFLRHHGCDMYQGYIVSPPLPADNFVRLLQSHPGQNA